MLGILEILRRVQLDGEVARGVDNAEGVTLWDEALEGTLIEDVDESFALYHLFQFLEECCAVAGGHLLEAYAFANSFLNGTRLAEFHDTVVIINNHLDFLFATLMTIQRQGITLSGQHGTDERWVEEDVAVRKQEVFALGIGTCHPQREDVVVVLIVCIVDEVDVQRGVLFRQKVANHLCSS